MKIDEILENLQNKSEATFKKDRFWYKILTFLKYRLRSDAYYIKKKYQHTTRQAIDLGHPIKFSEKLQWYKYNYKNPLIITCSDKFEVREYVSTVIGEKFLMPLVFKTDNPNKIRSKNFPNYPTVIKSNHDSYKMHNIRDRDYTNWKGVQKECRWWLEYNAYYSTKEWQYEFVKPLLIVEKVLADTDGLIPTEYGLHFIHGRFEFIQLELGSFGKYKRNLYDSNWELLPFTYSLLDKKRRPLRSNGRVVDKPLQLELMIELATKLAEPFPYVRVDFQIVKEEVYFNALTFQPNGGFEQFKPSSYNKYYGEKLQLLHY